jgi:transposase-like protein
MSTERLPGRSPAAEFGRGVADACMVICDGLSGLPDAIAHAWPQALVHT